MGKYCEDGSNDLDSSYYSDGEVVSDTDGNAAKLCPSFSNVNDEWSAVGRPHKDFGYTKDTSNCAQVVSQSPIGIYNLFLTDDVLNCMVDETNRYARQTIVAADSASPHARIGQWRDTNVDEMRQFIGLVIWMGLVSLPCIENYWSTNRLYRNSVAKAVMARNRFQLMLKLWHFDDNSTDIQHDRLHKIRRILELLVNNFQMAKQPPENVVIDETMVPFRGRLKFKQYIPGKSSSMELSCINCAILLAIRIMSLYMQDIWSAQMETWLPLLL